jgi:bifunctional non-homologous end joining protein LigD
MFLRFIQPCSPVLANTVPAGDDWQHEIKFDGFRVQIHKLGNEVELYSRNGSRFSRRFPRLVSVLRELPAKSAILDGEIVASDAVGMPDFWRLFLRSAKPAELHVWAFDLLALNRKDLRKWSLEARQGRLHTLVSRFDSPVLLHSEAFDDGEALLRVAEKHGLEGVVSKRRDAPYRSGACRRWRKVKTTAWREANRERWRLFETPER